jgi:monovalent cation:proton antiporter-2 (CPA2) family protein
MHSDGFFFQVFIYLTAALLAVPLAKRLGLGSVLGYLIAGVLIGPFCIGLVGEEGAEVMHFAEFGVVMMLFLIGLELSPSLFWRLRKPIVGLGGFQLLFTALAFAAIAIATGQPWQTALAIGLILSLSSTAIVLQTLHEKGLMKTDAGQSSFSVLLFQDVSVIPMLAALPLLAVNSLASDSGVEHPAPLEALPGWLQTIAVLAAVGLIILVGRFFVRPAFRLIARTRLREMFTAAALMLVVGIALLMDTVGLSPALGTFLAGVVLAGSEYRHQLEADIEPLKGLLLGLFFISVGSSLDFQQIATEPGTIGALVATLVTVKFVVLFLLGRFFCRMGLDQNFLFSFSLAQGSEFGFVLLSFAAQDAVLPLAITSSLVAAIAVSMSFTPLLLLINEKLIQPRSGTQETDLRDSDTVDEENPVIIAGFGRFGEIVGRFLRANGVGTTVLEYDSDHVELLRKLGLKVYYGDATNCDLLRMAGAEKARLLILSIDDHTKTLEIVASAREQFPNLTILARAAGRQEAYELLECGVKHVYRETLDTSLRMGRDALRQLGFRSFQAFRTAKTFRRHDEESVQDLAGMRHDEESYLSLARQRIHNLEEVLLGELKHRSSTRDVGWDTESLIQEFGANR